MPNTPSRSHWHDAAFWVDRWAEQARLGNATGVAAAGQADDAMWWFVWELHHHCQRRAGFWGSIEHGIEGIRAAIEGAARPVTWRRCQMQFLRVSSRSVPGSRAGPNKNGGRAGSLVCRMRLPQSIRSGVGSWILTPVSRHTLATQHQLLEPRSTTTITFLPIYFPGALPIDLAYTLRGPVFFL
jgi:hypothetical protein